MACTDLEVATGCPRHDLERYDEAPDRTVGRCSSMDEKAPTSRHPSRFQRSRSAGTCKQGPANTTRCAYMNLEPSAFVVILRTFMLKVDIRVRSCWSVSEFLGSTATTTRSG